MTIRLKLYEGDYFAKINRRIINSGSPIINKDGYVIARLHRHEKEPILILRAFSRRQMYDVKNDMKYILNIARQIAKEFKCSLLVDTKLANEENIVNFVEVKDNVFMPMLYDELFRFSEIRNIKIIPRKTVTFIDKRGVYFHIMEELKLPENIKMTLINDMPLNKYFKDENNVVIFNDTKDYSKITVRTEDKESCCNIIMKQ